MVLLSSTRLSMTKAVRRSDVPVTLVATMLHCHTLQGASSAIFTGIRQALVFDGYESRVLVEFADQLSHGPKSAMCPLHNSGFSF